ncbi:MAG: hypothetical protein P1P84_08215 [Deferrisomatales bacterium]|nr:hypothetical protein [Deferrisomatales bacterium]
MERRLGLSRDPFSPLADGELYWESAARGELRRQLAEQLRSGCSVRLEGTPGSGRRSLLARVADELAAGGAPVALLDGPGEETPEAFLAGLAAAVGANPPSGAGLLTLAEHLYCRLVDVFCAARPAVVVLPWAPAGDVAEEIGILTELRLLGRPLVAVAVVGSPALPTGEFASVAVPELSPDDLCDCLAHRCAAAGRADLLSPAALEACLAGAPGLPTALRRARALWRARVFASALEALEAPATPTPPPVLDPAQVEEVRQLLQSLSPDAL